MNNLATFLSLTEKEISNIVAPLIEICDAILLPLISVVAALGTIWCVILGVKYARADDPQEHEKAKNGLKNAIVGFVLIFVLLIVLKILVPTLQSWVVNYDPPVI